MIREFIHILYPRRCPICGGIVVPKDQKACPDCVKELQIITEPRCMKCSKPIGDYELEYCFDCRTKRYHYTRGYALWVYDKNMRKSISDFKYHNKREYADFYVEEIIKHCSSFLCNIKADAFIPIPIHKSKYKVRGYNQAEIIASGIGRQLGVLVLHDVLIRDKRTLPQKGLNDKERLKNLIQAFSVDKDKLENYNSLKKVILVDDIYTTGSTIEACADLLLHNGIKEVYFISLCIGKGF